MALAYTIKDQFGLHFVTFTVHQWADVFTRRDYADIVINSLKFCQKEKGLAIYAWVIMSNHVHLIIQSNQTPLSDITNKRASQNDAVPIAIGRTSA